MSELTPFASACAAHIAMDGNSGGCFMRSWPIGSVPIPQSQVKRKQACFSGSAYCPGDSQAHVCAFQACGKQPAGCTSDCTSGCVAECQHSCHHRDAAACASQEAYTSVRAQPDINCCIAADQHCPCVHMFQVRAVMGLQLPPYKFWAWWCGGLSVLDALIVVFWVSVASNYLSYNITTKFARVEGGWLAVMHGITVLVLLGWLCAAYFCGVCSSRGFLGTFAQPWPESSHTPSRHPHTVCLCLTPKSCHARSPIQRPTPTQCCRRPPSLSLSPGRRSHQRSQRHCHPQAGPGGQSLWVSAFALEQCLGFCGVCVCVCVCGHPCLAPCPHP